MQDQLPTIEDVKAEYENQGLSTEGIEFGYTTTQFGGADYQIPSLLNNDSIKRQSEFINVIKVIQMNTKSRIIL